MSLLDIVTGGKSSEASDAEQKALAALQAVPTPTAEQLSIPELMQYAVSQNMTPAQMQAFLQQYNALNQPISQTGTENEAAALAQLANTAAQGSTGNATEQAQEAQIMQDVGRNLAGQRGAIEQQAQARGVTPGLLQAALEQQNAGQDAQTANQAALQAQSQNYQLALQALTGQGQLGQGLQQQQNTQANTVAQATNAMQQFNAANQQNAAAANAGYKQAANQYNTGVANTVGEQNTGLVNQRTFYNTQAKQQAYNDAMQKAMAEAGQYGNIANTATGQGNLNAGIAGAITGATGSFMGIGPGGQAGIQGNQPAGSSGYSGAPSGGSDVGSQDYMTNAMANSPLKYNGGPINMKAGGPVPGRAKVLGDSPVNDTVHARLSPKEYVLSRETTRDPNKLANAVGELPIANHPEDVATLLAALRHLRGQNNAAPQR